MESRFIVYLLYSPNYDKYYVGQTRDISTRLLFHNEISCTSYTSKYRPWILKRAIGVKSQGVAVRVERYIKGRKSRRYLERLIEDAAAVRRLLEKYE